MYSKILECNIRGTPQNLSKMTLEPPIKNNKRDKSSLEIKNINSFYHQERKQINELAMFVYNC